MNREDLIALGLTEEQADKVMEKTKNTVPYSRFKEVTDEKNELKAQLSSRDEQLKGLAKLTKDNEDLTSKIKGLQEENAKTVAESEARLTKIKLDNAIDLALMQAGANNSKTVKPLLNLENIKLDNEKLIGFDEQLTQIKTNNSYLFKQEQVATPKGVEPSVKSNPLPSGEVTLASALKSLYSQN